MDKGEARVQGGGSVITLGGRVFLDAIPEILIGVGQTHDMNQYINDSSNIITSTTVLGLSTFANYDPGTRELSYLADGTETGVTLEVTF